MRIVTDGEGSYAIVYFRSIFTMFYDLRDDFWWSYSSRYIDHCWGSIEEVDEQFKKLRRRKKWKDAYPFYYTRGGRK